MKTLETILAILTGLAFGAVVLSSVAAVVAKLLEYPTFPSVSLAVFCVLLTAWILCGLVIISRK